MEVCDNVCDDQTSWENSEEMCLSTFFQENKMSYGYKGESGVCKIMNVYTIR